MNISNNFYFFLLNDLILEKNFFYKNVLKFFSIKQKFLVENLLLKNCNFVFIVEKKNFFLFLKVLSLNINNILFFYYNNRFYSNNFINTIIKENFFKFNLKKNILLFSKIFFYNINKIVFLLKILTLSKKCQH